MIKHEKGKWILYSSDGTKVLGRFDSKKKALEHERAVQYFKRHTEEPGEISAQMIQSFAEDGGDIDAFRATSPGFAKWVGRVGFRACKTKLMGVGLSSDYATRICGKGKGAAKAQGVLSPAHRYGKHKFAEVPSVCIFEHEPGRDGYDEEALDTIVANFSGGGKAGRIRKQAGDELDNPLVVIGHDEEQKLLTDSSLPAAGWVADLWREGRRLMARITDVPRMVAEAIEKRIYPKRSAEFYRDYAGNGPALRRVALLGGDIPAKKNLGEMVFETYAEGDMDVDLIVSRFSENESMLTEEEIKKLQESLDALKKSDEEKAKLIQDLEAENAALKEEDPGEGEGKADDFKEKIGELEMQVKALREKNKAQADSITEIKSRALEVEADKFAEDFCRKKGLHLVDGKKLVKDAYLKLALDKFGEKENALTVFQETMDKLVTRQTVEGMVSRTEGAQEPNEELLKKEYDEFAELNCATEEERKKYDFEWWKRNVSN